MGSSLEESSSPPWPVWWWSYILCPGLQGSDTRPYFFMWAAHCCAAVGVAPFVAALPLLEKKACMLSYMKDICNWTAGPKKYIYNSKQNMLRPVSSVSPPFLPEEMYLHIFKNIRSKNRQNTGYHSCDMLYISRDCSKCTSTASTSHNSTLWASREIQWIHL